MDCSSKQLQELDSLAEPQSCRRGLTSCRLNMHGGWWSPCIFQSASSEPKHSVLGPQENLQLCGQAPSWRDLGQGVIRTAVRIQCSSSYNPLFRGTLSLWTPYLTEMRKGESDLDCCTVCTVHVLQGGGDYYYYGTRMLNGSMEKNSKYKNDIIFINHIQFSFKPRNP